MVRDKLRDQEGEPNAQREAGRVERDCPGSVARRQPIGQGLQPRHVGAGETETRERPDGHARPETDCEQTERDRRKAADDRSAEKNEARVDPIGEGRQHGDRQHVAEGVAAGEQPAFGRAQTPGRHEVLSEIGRQRDVRQQIADLSEAHRRYQRAMFQCERARPHPAAATRNTRSRPHRPASPSHRPRSRRKRPASRGPPQHPAAAPASTPPREQTPVSGSSSSTRAAASLSPAMSAAIERTCS